MSTTIKAESNTESNDGLNWEISPMLVEKAGDWSLQRSDLHLSDRTIPCIRCGDCTGVICAGTDLKLEDVVSHMLHEHGYRMDGRQFSNSNELVEA